MVLDGCWASIKSLLGHPIHLQLPCGSYWSLSDPASFCETGWTMKNEGSDEGIEMKLENKDNLFFLLSRAFSLLPSLSQYSWCRIIVHRPFQSSGTASSQPITSSPRHRLFHLHPSTTANGSAVQTKSRNALHQTQFLDWTQHQIRGFV